MTRIPPIRVVAPSPEGLGGPSVEQIGNAWPTNRNHYIYTLGSALHIRGGRLLQDRVAQAGREHVSRPTHNEHNDDQPRQTITAGGLTTVNEPARATAIKPKNHGIELRKPFQAVTHR
ncbi:hypothetical protein [Corynebacterium cystitidis]|uniref:hypothetical protein n=1 Tax=Corynebacterium cystitidis TaxID=35757 RepID=UPI00211ECCD1|nr:hypothetical protein [Corynebacterium cystitidis]